MSDERDSTGSMDPRLRHRASGWWLLGVALLAVLAWIGLTYLGWVVFGLFAYYVGRPIARFLRRRIPSRSLTAGLTLAFIIVPVVLFIAAFLSVALGQALDLLSSEAVMAVVERLPVPTTGLPTEPVDLVVEIFSDPGVSTILGQFGVAVGAFMATLFNLFLALVFAFFLLVEDERLAGWVERTVLGPGSLSTDYLRSVDRGLTSIYFGYTLTIFAVIVLAALIYTLFNLVVPGGLRIPSAILFAVVTGVFTLIPLVGRSVVYVFIVGLLSAQALGVNPGLLWIPLVFFLFMVVVFDNVVRTYIRPYLSGKTYNMALVMFAYLLGPPLFGWYGIFMGPLLMVLVVEFAVGILPRLAAVGSGASGAPGARPGATDLGDSPVERGDTPDSDREDTPSG
jgi:predicted PurR-regulated permease PerM